MYISAIALVLLRVVYLNIFIIKNLGGKRSVVEGDKHYGIKARECEGWGAVLNRVAR